MNLKTKLALLLVVIVAITAAASAWAARWFGNPLFSWLLILGGALLPVLWLSSRIMRPIQQLLRALSGAVASYRDGDFSLSLVADRDDEARRTDDGAQ